MNLSVRIQNLYPLLIEAIVRDSDERLACILISRGADVNVQDPGTQLTPLLAAVQFGKEMDLVEILIDKGAKLDVPGNEGNTPLLVALTSQQTEAARILIGRVANVNVRNTTGNTPLHYVRVLEDEPVDLLGLLLKKRANLEAVGEHGLTRLLTAAARGDREVTRRLIAAGANVNARSSDGRSALMFAVRSSDVDAVRALLVRMADVNARDRKGQTALRLARIARDAELLRLLKQAGAKE